MARKGKSYFFTDRNTAVRGAEVHSLPPFDDAQGTGFYRRIWTAGTWEFWDGTFYLLLWIGERIF